MEAGTGPGVEAANKGDGKSKTTKERETGRKMMVRMDREGGSDASLWGGGEEGLDKDERLTGWKVSQTSRVDRPLWLVG